jgi:hypothetical protein
MLVQNGTVDKKRLAYRFRHVRALYEDPRGVRALFSPLQLRELDNLLCEIDRFSDGWLSRAQQLLRFTSSQCVLALMLIAEMFHFAAVLRLESNQLCRESMCVCICACRFFFFF